MAETDNTLIGFHGAWVRFREHMGATRIQAASVMEELVYNIE